MKKPNERPLWIRELFALALSFVMIVPICAMLTSEGIKYAHRREEEHLSIRTKRFEEIARNESRVFASAQEWYDRNLSANIRLMTDSLKTFATEAGYMKRAGHSRSNSAGRRSSAWRTGPGTAS